MSTSSGGINLASLLQASQLVTDGHHVTGSVPVTGSGVTEDDSKMEEETEIESSVTELSMEDLMDVVTTYKCKFCQFTAHQPEAISEHIKSVHIDLLQASKKKKVPSQTQPQEQHQTQQIVTIVKPDETAQQSKVVITEDQLPGLRQVLQVSEGTQVIVQDDNGEHITLVAEGEAENIVEQAYHVSTTIEEEDGGTAMLVSATDLKNHVEEAEHVDVIVSAETQTEPEDGAGVVNEKPINDEPGAEPGAEDDSHMFVCGQCNLGFTNIEECKQHMVKDHNITMEAMECLDAEVEKEIHGAPNKVSVATQVVPAKRPGRKPKRAVVELVPETVSEEEIEDDEDEEESENIQVRRNESDDSGYGKGKRRIRPPKAMTDIYYMGKKKPPVVKKRRMDRLEGYDLSCSVVACSAKFKTAEVLLLHQQCHIDVKERKMRENKTKDGQDAIFSCPHCPQRFKLWKQVRSHLWKDHQVDTDLLTCDKCEFRCESLLKLEMHQEIHSDDRAHICQICNKSFKQASQLRNHRVNVHKKEDIKSGDPIIYSCHICKREFATAKYLHNHLQQVHATVKPFQCAYCSHTTARKAMMELHIRTHTGEKPYKCNLCNYATGDHNSLRRHKMRHSGRKPYKCQHCPYSCIQAISLKTHMKNKHPGCSEGIFMCDQCQYRTVNKQNYDNHLEDHRNGLVSLGQDGEEDQAGNSSRRRVTNTKTVKGKPQAYTMGTINTVDLSKVPGMEGLAPSEMNAAQLIYAALNATSQQQRTDTSQAVSEAAIQQASSVTSTTHDGVTTHTITLHLPQLSTGAPAELPPGTSQEGTSSATMDVGNPVVLAVNQGNPQAINLFTHPTAEPSAAAGEVVHLATDGNHGQQQVTDIVQAIQGLEVLHQGGDTGQAHILQAAPQQAHVIQGLEVLPSSQVLQALGGLQSFEGIQVLQPHIGNTISVDGQTLQIQGQNIIASDTGHVLFKTEEGDSEAQQNSSEQS